MKEEKRQAIIDAAIKAFAERGYQYATIDEIAKEAGVAKGLVHVYFENKLDLLLSVILLFAQTVNRLNQEKLSRLQDPVEKLHALFATFQELLTQSQKNLYWGHILREGLPKEQIMKSDRQRLKLKEVAEESAILQNTLDTIIEEGQKQGRIDASLKPQVIRQILGGASQLLYYGLSLERNRNREPGYDEYDIRNAMAILINRFTKSNCRNKG